MNLTRAGLRPTGRARRRHQLDAAPIANPFVVGMDIAGFTFGGQ